MAYTRVMDINPEFEIYQGDDSVLVLNDITHALQALISYPENGLKVSPLQNRISTGTNSSADFLRVTYF